MRWIIRTSMRLQYIVIVSALVLIIFGISQIRDMPIDTFPEINPPLVEVQTEALGLSAEEMEALITVPLEADLLNGVAWLDQIYSETVAGMSSILLVFEPGTDPIRARQMVQERLTQTFALPNVSKPPTMLQPLSASNRVMIIGLSAEEMSLIDMSVLAHWVIAPRLTGVPGVANVAVWGQRDWQLQVQVDPERLNENGVTLQQIVTTTGEAMWVSPLNYLESSSPGTSGWIDTPNQRLGIQHFLPIAAAEDMAKIPVIDTDNLLLGDVATIVEDHQILIGDALLSDGPGLLIVIEKFPNANTLEVTQGVDDALQALQPGLGGIKFDATIFRSADYINQAVKNLSRLAIVSGILIIVTLSILTLRLRKTLISAIGIVTALVTATFIMYLGGFTLNIMTVAGLSMAIAMLVHNVIVDVDNVVRNLRQHPEVETEKTRSTIITNAMLEIREPLAYALLIIFLTILPIFFIGNSRGLFLRPFAVAYIGAILSSLAAALIVTPALCFVLLGNSAARDAESAFMGRLKTAYSNLLGSIINRAEIALIASLVLVVIGMGTLFLLQFSLMPTLRQPDVRIQWEAAPATSREAMLRITNLASDELEAIPGVSNVGSHIGRAVTGDKTVGINAGEIWVSINPAVNYDEALATIQEVINGYPGLFRVVDTYQPERLASIFTQPDHDVVVRLYGHEFDELDTLADTISQNLSNVEGLSEITVIERVEEPQIEIEVDLQAAERYQTSPGQVRRAVTTLLSGLTVGNLYEEQKVFEVVVWGVPELRNSISDVQNLLIDTPTGQVPLSELADVRISSIPTKIQRDAVQRFVDIGATITGHNLDAVIADIDVALEDVTFPLEYHAEIVTNNQLVFDQRTLLMLIIAVAIGIFLLLQAAYQNWQMASVAFLMIPVALSGSVIAILLTGGTISLGSLLGMLTVIGLAVRMVTITITYYQRHIGLENDQIDGDNIAHVAQIRFVPIMMTVVTLAIVYLSIAVTGNIAGTEIVQPMSIVVLGGLVTITLLNIFILPTLYLRFGSNQYPALA